MFSRDAFHQIAADRRAEALHAASTERTAGLLRRFRRHAPPVLWPSAPVARPRPRPEVQEPQAA
jgi:hypothetical protein